MVQKRRGGRGTIVEATVKGTGWPPDRMYGRRGQWAGPMR